MRENIKRNKTAVDRLSKMALWKEPSSAFAARQREVADLEGRLRLLG